MTKNIFGNYSGRKKANYLTNKQLTIELVELCPSFDGGAGLEPSSVA